MNDTTTALPAEAGGYESARFNALRHGVLSRYTVLPWEDEGEYRPLLDALVAEHAPQGPTEEHLVEELAGIFWRKRRLRLAEAAAYHRGLARTIAPYHETVTAALVHRDVTRPFEKVIDAIRPTPAETAEDMADLEKDEAMTRRALDLLGAGKGGRLTGSVRAVALGKVDGEPVVVSGGADDTVRLWDGRTGHTDEVSAVALGEVDGESVVVSGSRDTTVRLWDGRTLGLLRVVPLDSEILGLAMGRIRRSP